MKTKGPNTILPCILPWVWMGGIFWLSSQPTLPSPPEAWLDLLFKKSGHMVVYGILAILWYHCGHPPNNNKKRTWLYIAWGLAVLYAFSDEYHQSFVPGRHATLRDVGIDAIGAALGLYLHERYRRKRHQPTQ